MCIKQSGVDIFQWQVMVNWCTHFFISSLYLLIEALGKPICHLRAASLKVPESRLHFKESGAHIMVIYVLMEETYS